MSSIYIRGVCLYVTTIIRLGNKCTCEDCMYVCILSIIPFLTMIYWVLTLAISPEGQEVFSSTLAGQL